jgi:hypothetical protein
LEKTEKYIFLNSVQWWQNLVYSHISQNQTANKQSYFQILTKSRGFKELTRSMVSWLDLLQDNTLVYRVILIH